MKLADPTIHVPEQPPARTAWWKFLAYWATGRNRRVSLVWIVSLAYSVALVLNILVLFRPAQLSFMLDAPTTDTRQVAWVLPDSILWRHGVRAGDSVLALNGHSPSSQAAGIWTGEQVRLRSATGQLITVEASLIRQGRDTWPLVLLSPWFLLLGTLVYLRAPHPAIGQATYALFASAAFALALAPASINEYLVGVIAEWTAVNVFVAYFALFFLVFPRPRAQMRLRTLLLVPPIISIVLNLITLRWPALHVVSEVVRNSTLLAYLLLGVGLLVHSLVTTKDRAARRGLAIISGGTLASVIPFIGLYLLPFVLGFTPLLTAEYAILPLAILPASFAYAILRHRTVDISLVQRWLVHGLVWGILLLGYAAIVYGMEQVDTGLPEPLRSLVLAAIIVVLVGGSFPWLRERLQHMLDRVIFKDSYEYRPALRALSQDLSSTISLDVLTETLPGTLRRLMNLDWALLLVHHGHTPRALGAVGAYQPAILRELSAAARAVQRQPQVVALAYGYLHVLVVPLRIGDAVVGHLCLGPKATGEPFRADDQELLMALSGQIAGIVQNAQLLNDLRANAHALDLLTQRLQRAQEDERARLSADIHDEPLQTAMQLQRHLAAGDENGTTAAHLVLSQTVIDQLRAVCSRIRPAALEDLGLRAALDSLIQEQSNHSGVPIRLDVDPEFDDTMLSPTSETVLYRAAQEAITNSLRHARPRSIAVRVRRHDAVVELSVEDDGIGFESPPYFDQLVEQEHFGLAGLQQRVRREGGSLEIESQPGKGTTVRVALPVEEVTS